MPNDQSWNVATARVAANINLGAAYTFLATPAITATATSSSSTSIALTTPSPNAVSYTIERSTNGGQSWSVLITNRIPSDFPYTDADLTAETTYSYRIIAEDATDTSDYSAVTSDTTPAAPTGGLTTIYSEDFESGDLSGGANGFVWLAGLANTAIIPAVTTNNPKTGTYSLEFTYVQKQSSDESWSEQPFNLGALYKEVDIEFDLYIPDGTEPWGTVAWSHNVGDGSSSNRKTNRLWGSDPSKEAGGGVNSYNSTEKLGYEWYVRTGGGSRLVSLHASAGEMGPSGPNRVHDDFITPSDLGTWIHLRLHSKMPTGVGTADGFNRAYRNGVLVVDNPIDNFSSDPAADHAWQHGYLLGYFNQSPASNLKVHIDNVVFKGVPK